ncbi:MAG TPA: hypothetical protein VKI44_03775 [Acetobacteraceae bacterium]|nr:hypothetical protein [Acetobacteraceae bacterium]
MRTKAAAALGRPRRTRHFSRQWNSATPLAGRLDWHAIAATIPGRGAQSAAVQFYKLLPAPCARPTAPTPHSVT